MEGLKEDASELEAIALEQLTAYMGAEAVYGSVVTDCC